MCETIAPGSVVLTDAWGGYNDLARQAALGPEDLRSPLRDLGRTLHAVRRIDQSVLVGSKLMPGD